MKNTTKIIIDSLLVIPVSVLAYLLYLGIGAGTFQTMTIAIIFWTLILGFYISIPALFAFSFAIMYLWRRFGPAKLSRVVSILFAVMINAIALHFFFMNTFS